MLNVLKYIFIAFLILLDISCIYCSFKEKPVYPYFVWFAIITISIVFLLI